MRHTNLNIGIGIDRFSFLLPMATIAFLAEITERDQKITVRNSLVGLVSWLFSEYPPGVQLFAVSARGISTNSVDSKALKRSVNNGATDPTITDCSTELRTGVHTR